MKLLLQKFEVQRLVGTSMIFLGISKKSLCLKKVYEICGNF